jgi:hypothetical protein
MTVSLPTPCFFFTGARKKVGKHVLLVSNVNFSKNYTKSNSENVSRNYLHARWGEKKNVGVGRETFNTNTTRKVSQTC